MLRLFRIMCKRGSVDPGWACVKRQSITYSGPSRYPGVPPVDMQQAFKSYKKSAELLERENSVPEGTQAGMLIQNLGCMYVGRQVGEAEFRPCTTLLKKFAKGEQHVRLPATEALKCKYWACYTLAHFAYDANDRPLAAKRYRAQVKVFAALPQDFTQHPGVRATYDIAQDNLKRMYGEMPTLREPIRLDSDDEGDGSQGPRFAVVEREAGGPRSYAPANLPPDCSWRDAAPTVAVNAPDLQRPRCAACGTTDVHLQRCSRCKAVSYCGRECQAADWRTHKATCNRG